MNIGDSFAAYEGFLATPEEIRKWGYALMDLNAVESMEISYMTSLHKEYTEHSLNDRNLSLNDSGGL